MFWALFTILFLAGYAALIFFYYKHWKKLNVYRPAQPPAVFVSVVIAARNEEKTLPLLLEDLARQAYPFSMFEVIIVNDFSTDGTAAVGEALDGLHARMILPDAKAEASSKKAALATGIGLAKGELILVTDADCRVGQDWLQTIASFYAETGASFIAAPVKYVYQSSLLQALQVLDFVTLQGITAASVAANFHTMCNGANLAYTKKAFLAVNGFAGIDSIPTGDDMLLMHKIWKRDPSKVFYLKSEAAIVTTTPMQTWKQFLMQRRRWASKTLVYDDKRIIAVLAFVLLLNLLPFALLVAGFFQPACFLYLLFFLAKAVIEWPFISSVAAFFNQQKLMRYFFFLQPLHVFYTVLAGLWSQVGSYEWKGRKARPVASLNPSREGLSTKQPLLDGDTANDFDSLQSGPGAMDNPPPKADGGAPGRG